MSYFDNSIRSNPNQNNTTNKIGVRFNINIDNYLQKQQSPLEPSQPVRHDPPIPSEPKFRSIVRTSVKGKRRTLARDCVSTDRIAYHHLDSQDQEIKNTLDGIQERGATFYKYGFVSAEKKGKNRKIFGDYFNLRYEEMKGIMSVGELWSSKQRSNYLRQNKIYINKVKLIEKINYYKKQSQLSRKKLESQNTLISSFGHLMSGRSMGTTKNLSDGKSQVGDKKLINFEKNLLSLRKQMAKLHKDTSKESIKDMFKSLEDQTQNMDKLQRSYFLKLIDML